MTGLVTGGDLIRQLKGKELGECLIIPAHMLRDGENVFLDDVTTDQAEASLGVPVIVADPEGSALCRSILGEEETGIRRRRQMYEQTDRSDRGEA